VTATASKNGRLDKAEVIAQLTPQVVATIYERAVGQSHRAAGEWRKCPSPFYADSNGNPGFNWHPETGHYRDHSKDEKGDIFDFVMRAERCSFTEALTSVAEVEGLTPKPTATPRTSPILKAYDYVDENGTVLSQTVRFHDKRFSQRQPRPGGGWINNLQGVRRVPYRLPELLAADQTVDVLILEGEKDVDRAIAEGFVATTNAMGAGSWPNDLNIYLADRHVVLIPDNDDAGRDHVAKVARGLPGIVETTKITPLPDLPVKGDFSDWFNAGGTAEELRHLIMQTPEWQPEPAATNNGRTSASVEPQEPRVFANTDTGNAERLVALHGSEIRFNWGRKVWHTWSGRHWEEDRAGRMEQLAKSTARQIPDEARHLTAERYTSTIKWAAASESSGKRQATIDLARSEDGVPVQPHELDADPWLLNVANGTLDLRDGTLRPHQCEDLITRLIDVPYDPDATCPRFMDFLDRIFDRDEGLIGYVQRLVGYSMTGSTREQIMAIAYGTGSNGKTTLLGTLRGLLGNYAQEADADSFMERRHEGIREDIADLDGARFVAASETADGKRLSEALVKKMTGGEMLRARRLYENGYTFAPQFTVWLSTNHKPEIRGTEFAIWRRIRLVPFTVTINEAEKDADLPTKLADEYPGILAWAVRGCMDWQRDGLNEPDAVLRATASYREDMDPLAAWFADRCIVQRNILAEHKKLYEDYLAYCDTAGDDPVSSKAFGEKLGERGFEAKRTNNARCRKGLRLRTGPDDHGQTTFESDRCDRRDADPGNFSSNTSYADFTGESVTPVTSVTIGSQPTLRDDEPFDSVPLEDDDVPF